MGQNENRFFNKRLQLCKRGRRDFEVGGVSAGRKPRLAATLQKTPLQNINDTKHSI